MKLNAKTFSLIALIWVLPVEILAENSLSLPVSIEIRVSGAYVRTSPSVQGSRRGTLAYGARLQPLESKSAGGCDRLWYRIGPEAWICGESVARRGSPPSAKQLPVVEDGEIVPYRYGFAGPDGARLYKTLEDIEYDEWHSEFDPRSGLHLKSKISHDGMSFYRLVKGGYVPVSDVRPARPSRYSGVELGEGKTAGFVNLRSLKVRPQPNKGRVIRRIGRRVGFQVFERSKIGRLFWLRIGENEWIRDQGIRRSDPVEPPPSISGNERWIHVNRSRQILTAYQGKVPVFATLISSGRKGSATPTGIFRIWAKLETGSMSDEGETIDDRPYLMQGVPWVMYFNEGIAIHAAYWHNDFGKRRSHGCVNLAPDDARWIFEWSQPALPPGWIGVLPTRSDPGTIVVVQ